MRPQRLSGLVAIVTGGGQGIGRAIAARMLEEGARVVIFDIDRHAAEDAVAEYAPADGGVVPDAVRSVAVRAEIGSAADEADIQRAIEATVRWGGRLDILVNNAGLTKDNLFMVMKDEQWDDVIAVNLTSTFMLMRAGTRHMLRSRTGYGRIINISSVSGIVGNPGQGNYAASKAGMIGMTKSLAREVAPRGITANCIAPGFIKTAMTDALNEQQMKTIMGAIPAQTFGEPGDIAACAVYLASNEARYVTGQTLHVNGGMVMP
jgi:3-oxoacyl-[acyl-carrier protein] reductase